MGFGFFLFPSIHLIQSEKEWLSKKRFCQVLRQNQLQWFLVSLTKNVALALNYDKCSIDVMCGAAMCIEIDGDYLVL